MAQELTLAQLERIKQQRIQKFKAIGLPETAGQIADIPIENIPEQRVYEAPQQTIPQPQHAQQIEMSMEMPNKANIEEAIQQQLAEERAQRNASMYTAPRDKFSALEAIRRGAKKQEFKQFIKAEYSGVNGNQIPETKVGKRKSRPGQQQEKSSNAIEPQSFSAKGNAGELGMLESLFTDKSPGINVRSSGNGVPQGNLIETDENYSNVGAHFDPVAHLKAKAAEKGVNIDFNKNKKLITENNTPQVFQTGNSEQMSQMMLMMEAMMKTQQKNNYDLPSLKEMITEIAKKTAEDTIRKVLKEYLENQKKKNVFEVVNKEKNVVKIGDKYFQLKQVVVKS